MKKKIFEYIDDLYEDILEYVDDNPGSDVAIVGYYETILFVLHELIREGYDISSCEIDKPEFDGYEDAYYIEISNGEIWCGKMMAEDHDHYLYMENDMTYVEEDFTDDYFMVNNDQMPTIIFGFKDVHSENEHDDSDDSPCLCLDEDRTGFTFCLCDGTQNVKFKYKGNKKLTMNEAWDIVSKNLN